MEYKKDCGCLRFCEAHGRDEIEVGDEGEEFCNECAADGWSGELCAPSSGSCHMGHDADKANAWLRTFMCETHCAENAKFCEEVLAEEDE